MCHVSFAIFGLGKGNICQKPRFFPVHQEVSGKFSNDPILGHLIRHSTVAFNKFSMVFQGRAWHDHLPENGTELASVMKDSFRPA